MRLAPLIPSLLNSIGHWEPSLQHTSHLGTRLIQTVTIMVQFSFSGFLKPTLTKLVLWISGLTNSFIPWTFIKHLSCSWPLGGQGDYKKCSMASVHTLEYRGSDRSKIIMHRIEPWNATELSPVSSACLPDRNMSAELWCIKIIASIPRHFHKQRKKY